MHLVYPPKLCITIVLDFSWDDCNTQEKLETMVMQNSGGGGVNNYGLCESSEFLVIEGKARQKHAILDFLSLLYKSKVTP